MPKKRVGHERNVAFFLLPNLFTLFALLAGYYAIVKAVDGSFAVAGWAIVFAAAMDALDGRIARMIDAQSEFGAQLDSLSDAICFGLAPALLVFEWGLEVMGRPGFAVCFFFCAAAVVRLARFNVTLETSDINYFTGMPSPMAGIIAATAVLTFGDTASIGNVVLLMLLMVLLAVSMVSDVRYYSFKKFNVRARLHSPLLIVCALLAVSLVALILLEFGAGGLLGLGLTYLAVGYVRTTRYLLRQYRKFKADGKGDAFAFLRVKISAMLSSGRDGNEAEAKTDAGGDKG